MLEEYYKTNLIDVHKISKTEIEEINGTISFKK